MKIVRLILLGFATALAVINFWTVDYQSLWGTQSLWAYFRIAVAVFIIVVLVRMIRRTAIEQKNRK